MVNPNVDEHGCTWGQVTRVQMEQLRRDFDSHEAKQNGSMEKIWNTLDSLKQDYSKRLPNWASWVFSLMSMVLGAALAKVFG